MTPRNDARYLIITSQPAAGAAALTEAQKADAGARLVKKLSFEEQLLSIRLGYGDFLRSFAAARSVFIRHMFPVTIFGWNPDDYDRIISEADKALPFAIQARSSKKSADGSETDLKDITIPLEQALIGRGFTHDHKFPAQVVSIYNDGGIFYAGGSLSRDNISAYNGGARRFKKDDSFISRAEFKFLEAVESFGIDFPQGGRALDLGASPGGFTKALLEKGLDVTAVDPADMDERLSVYGERLTHYKGPAEKFIGAESSYDFLTNDIKADAADSVNITINAGKFLKRGAEALMTLKLSDGGWIKKTNSALRALESGGYSVKNARQLFNNRSEVTVYVKRP